MNNSKYSEMVSTDGNAQEFIFDKMLGEYAFIDLVRVIEVTGKTLTVQSLLLGRQDSGEGIDNLPIYNIPFLRLQRGASAVVMDPEIGDVGLMATCDKDISISKKTKKDSVPPSGRMHSKIDGVYLTGVYSLNQEPTQYVRFNDSGIDIKSPRAVNINGLQVLSDGRLQLVNGVIVDTHVHSGVESGGANTKGPQ